MNPSYYKYCIVPQCKSTSIKTPNKLFVFVPSKQEVRKKWLTLARLNDANCLSSISRIYFCEDHFDNPWCSLYRNERLNRGTIKLFYKNVNNNNGVTIVLHRLT
ncbi:hypothetical protein ABMA27_003727 [Loxostege sticticalis]|uniref:THAP-type domain-containing protein n=1 Tax=Loxostege sticticalis TaxID=481309 RepID=A0ABR3HQ32_LOXSC